MRASSTVRFGVHPRPALAVSCSCGEGVVSWPDLQVTHSPPVALEAAVLDAGPDTEVRLGEELPTLEVRLTNEQNVQVRVRLSPGLGATECTRLL